MSVFTSCCSCIRRTDNGAWSNCKQRLAEQSSACHSQKHRNTLTVKIHTCTRTHSTKLRLSDITNVEPQHHSFSTLCTAYSFNTMTNATIWKTSDTLLAVTLASKVIYWNKMTNKHITLLLSQAEINDKQEMKSSNLLLYKWLRLHSYINTLSIKASHSHKITVWYPSRHLATTSCWWPWRWSRDMRDIISRSIQFLYFLSRF